MKSNYRMIDDLVIRIDERNTDGRVNKLVGVSIDKCFINSVANVVGTDLTKYKIIRKKDFAVSLMQVSRDEKIPLAMLQDYDEAIMSPAYPIFRVKNEDDVLPEYLEMWFKRPEFDREASFIAVGGVRGSMPWEEFGRMKLPIPPIDRQRELVEAYKIISKRIEIKRKINDNLEAQAHTLYNHVLCSNDVSRRAINSFGAVITGKTPPTAILEYYGNDVPFIKTPDMHGSVYITKSECYLSAAGANSQKNKFIPSNSVVVACIGANAGEVSLTSYKAQTNQQINSIITKYPCFLYFAIKSNYDKLRTLGDGSSTMLNINKTSFETFQVECVENSILNALEQQLSIIFKEILNNILEINTINNFRSLLIASLSR